MTHRLHNASSRGFSLIEVLISLTILVVGVGALASLSGVATRANTAARDTTLATLLAAQKLEQLRSLAWTFGASPGAGLTPSPAEALAQNTPEYCDFLDLTGRSLGGGVEPPPQAAFIRRWAIDPLPADSADTLVLQVVVLRARRTARALPQRAPEARLATLKTRKAA